MGKNKNEKINKVARVISHTVTGVVAALGLLALEDVVFNFVASSSDKFVDKIFPIKK